MLNVNRIFTAFAEGLVSFSRKSGRQAWFVFLVAFSLIITLMTPMASYSQASQAMFNDIEGYWAQGCIEQLAQRKIISGYQDGSFKPNDPVTRVELAVMISKAFPKAPKVRSAGKFTDIANNYWAAPAISYAYTTGFMSSVNDKVFNPTQKMSRVQVLTSLVNGLKYSPKNPVANTLNQAFTDASEIPENAKSAIAAATEKQLVVNYPDARKLKPSQLVTRGEIAAFLCQATGTTGLVSSQYIARARTPRVATASVAPSSEIRGVWLTNIDSDVLFDRDRLSRAIQRLHDLNFNTIYPTVWNCGYTLYPSRVANNIIGRSLHPEPGLRRRDILTEMVDKGHREGMAVIPWFEFGFMAPADSGKLQCDPTSELTKRHPQWITSRRDGTTIWKEGPHDRLWLNPLHPGVQNFIKDLVVEMVRNYDIDGIQFDDHMGLPSDFGYDPFTVSLYQSEHNGQSPPNNPQNAEWLRWRADKITGFMAQLFRAIKDEKQKVVVSLSPNPQEFAYNSYLQDWESWERQGIVEELAIQLYRNDINRLIDDLERPEVKAARSHIPVAIGILTGTKPRPISIPQIQQQVEVVRERGFAGVSFFFYETLWNIANETPTERQAALKQIFPQPAQRPSLVKGWKPNTEAITK